MDLRNRRKDPCNLRSYDDLSLKVVDQGIGLLLTELKERSNKRRQASFKSSSEGSVDARIRNKDKAHECQYCEKSFKTTAHLNRHSRIHTGEKPYKCPLCLKSFARMDVCNFHVRNSCQLKSSSKSILPSSAGDAGELSAEKDAVKAASPEYETETSRNITVHDKSFLDSLRLKSHVSICTEENSRSRVATEEKLRSHVATDENVTPRLAAHDEENLTPRVAIRAEENLTPRVAIRAEENLTPRVAIRADENLRSHVATHSEKKSSKSVVPTKVRMGKKSKKCEYCEKSFRTKSHLDRHARIHTGEKPYECHLCQKSFARIDARNFHVRNNCHSKSSTVVAPSVPDTNDLPANKDTVETTTYENNSDCVKTFSSDSVHLGTPIPTHTENKPSKSVARTNGKNRRVRIVKNSHKCESCGKSFQLRANLTRHLLVHTGEKPFKCPLCEKSFARMDACNFHVQNNCKGKPEVSAESSIPDANDSLVNGPTVSDKPFPEEILLDSCVAAHSEEKVLISVAPMSPKQCRRFSDGGKGHECPSCHKSFRTKAHLNRHSRVHTGEKPYGCSLCHKSFSRLDVCKFHVKNNCQLKSPTQLSSSGTDASDLSAKKDSVEKTSRKNQNSGCVKRYTDLISSKSQITAHAEEEPSNFVACSFPNASDLPVNSAASETSTDFTIHKKSILESIKLESDVPKHPEEIPSRSKRCRKAVSGKEFHECQFCHKSFQKKSRLERHVRVHTGEKPFKCPSCQKPFARVDTCNIHLKNCREGKSLIESASSAPDASHLLSNNTFEIASDEGTVCEQSTPEAANLHSHAALRSEDKSDKSGDSSHLVSDQVIDEGTVCEKSMPEALNIDSQIAVRSKDKPSKPAYSSHLVLNDMNEATPSSVCEKSILEAVSLDSHTVVTSKTQPFKSVAHTHQTKRKRVCNRKRIYKCESCGKSFNKKFVLSRHWIIHTGEKPYKCPLCQKSFTRLDVCKVHTKSYCALRSSASHLVSNNRRTFKRTSDEGTVCVKSTPKAANLRAHTKAKTVKSGDPNHLVSNQVIDEDTVCKKSMPEALNSHIAVHSKNKSSKPAYFSHLVLNDMNEATPSSVCEKSIPETQSLDSHTAVQFKKPPSKSVAHTQQTKRKRVCNRKRPYKCQSCDKSFTEKGVLNRHLIIHTGEKPYKCPLCQKSFARSDVCRLHTKSYCEVRSSASHLVSNNTFKRTSDKGSVREKSTPKAANLRAHTKAKTVKSGDCSHLVSNQVIDEGAVCEKSMPEALNIDSHIAGQSEDKLSKPAYSSHLVLNDMIEAMLSSVCEKSIPEAGSLDSHPAVHSKKQPSKSVAQTHKTKRKRVFNRKRSYKCQPCGKSFNKKGVLSRHLIIHTGEKPYKCPLCQKSFARSDVCRLHTKGYCTLRSSTSHLVSNNAIKRTSEEGTVREKSTPEAANLHSHTVLHSEDKSGDSNHLVSDQVIDEGTVCEKSMREALNIDSHIAVHSKDKPSKPVYSSHLVLNYMNEATPSSACEKSITEAVSQDSHTALHSKKQPSKSAAQTHQTKRKRVFNRKRPYKCESCGKSFNKKGVLSRHLIMHTGEKPYKCPLCQKSFARSDVCRSHTKGYCTLRSSTSHLVSNNAFKRKSDEGTVCEKSTPEAANLPAHTKAKTVKSGDSSHLVSIQLLNEGIVGDKSMPEAHIAGQSEDKPSKSAYSSHLVLNDMIEATPSSVCGKSIPETESLDSHTALHSKKQPSKSVARTCQTKRKRVCNRKRPHKCQSCGKSFKTKAVLNRHLIIHTGEKPYKCPLCHKAFTRSDVCKLHTKSYCELRSSAMFQPVPATDQPPAKDAEPQTRSYKCTICGLTLSQASRLKLHMTAHDRAKPHKCHLCPKSFLRKDHFQVHVTTHLKERPHKCGVCDKSYAQSSTLKHHMAMHTGDKPHKCDLCVRRFKKAGELGRHMISHSDDRPHECQECNRSFKRSYDLTEHLRFHTGEKPYKCKFCPEAFETYQKHKMHMERCHLPEKEHRCEICGKSFRKASLLRVHMKIHSGVRNHVCHLCGKSLCNGQSLRAHLRRHAGERPYKCEFCGKSSVTLTGLKMHLTVVHLGAAGKRYKCTLCEKAFVSNGLLKVHMRSHTGERPYKCHLCEKAFYTSQYRKDHMISHTRERAYECKVCGKKYYSRLNVKQHMRMHTGEKPYKCSICDKLFIANNSLKTHMKLHTSEKYPRCLMCAMSFTKVSDLQYHVMVHLRQQLMCKCRFCDKSFAHRRHLQLHLRIHATKKPFRCRVCRRSFSTLYKLKIHRNIHALRRTHYCWICGKSFPAATKLAWHSKTHIDKFADGSDEISEDLAVLMKSISSPGVQTDMSKNAKETPYRCDVCHRSFTRPFTLKKHKQVHSEEKPFNCKLCNKTFKYGNGLQRHEAAIHLGNEKKPYKCDVCEKAFRDRYHLVLHIKALHATQETQTEQHV